MVAYVWAVTCALLIAIALAVPAVVSACGYSEKEDDKECVGVECLEYDVYDLEDNSKTGYLIYSLYKNIIAVEDDQYVSPLRHWNICSKLAEDYRLSLEGILKTNGFEFNNLWPDFDRRYASLLSDLGEESERCRTNTPAHVYVFLDAIAANDGAKQYLREFAVLRHELVVACLIQSVNRRDRDVLREKIVELAKKPGAEDFASYLQAAFDFYFYDDQKAKDGFKKLSSSANDNWVRETSLYMYARTLFVESQVRWDGYSGHDNIDKNLLFEAEKAFDNYVKTYPNGRYADSVRDFKRRVLLFAGKDIEFKQNIVYAFVKAEKNGNINKLFAIGRLEVDRYIDYSQVDFSWNSPLMATAMLFTSDSLPTSYKGDIEVQKARFDKYPDLYSLAKARILFLEHKDGELIKAFDTKNGISYGVFGDVIEIMRVLSMERLGKTKEARWALLSLSETSSYSSLALNLLATSFVMNEGAGAIANSEVAYPDLPGTGKSDVQKKLFNLLIKKAATNLELKKIVLDVRAQKAVKELATQVLLERLLLAGDFKEFLDVYQVSGKPSYFETVESAVTMLVSNPKDPKGLLKYGYFLQQKKLMPGHVYSAEGSIVDWKYEEYVKEKNPAAPQWLEDIPVGQHDPLYYYLEGLKSYSDGHVDNVEAELLYNAIHCYEQYEHSECLWEQERKVDVKVRKAWFDKLKSKYGKTTWAEKTKYYW